jgi:hypothetical protein
MDLNRLRLARRFDELAAAAAEGGDDKRAAELSAVADGLRAQVARTFGVVTIPPRLPSSA